MPVDICMAHAPCSRPCIPDRIDPSPTGSAAQAIQLDLNTSTELVAASVAIYMFAVGLAALVVGPASDRFGRKPVYLVSCLAFIATSIVCIFSPSIGVLIAFRSLQGFAGVCLTTCAGHPFTLSRGGVTDGILPCMPPSTVATFLAVGGAVVADVFPPEQRGTASGLFMIPLLVGPIVGPLLGGGLAEAFGWRSTFICLTVFGGGCRAG